MILSIPEFIGHLHPVLVHLPIGFLLLACLFLWQTRRNRFQDLHRSINISLGLGMISAVASCITGYVLSRTGDYEPSLIQWHQWMGISVAAVSILTFYCRRKPNLQKWQWILATTLLVLIFVTGHLGGSLTHGDDYLTAPLADLAGPAPEIALKLKPIPDVQQAAVFDDIIEPLFQARCVRCHGANRQKGKLRLDAVRFILAGGKDGQVISPGKSAESELVKRLLLPLNDEHHMAPKDRPQLTHAQINLVRWWIDNGADFSKKVKDFPQPPEIKPILHDLQRQSNDQSSAADLVPAANVRRADDSVTAG